MTLTVAHWVVRITGVLLLFLGLLFWTGDARALIPVHMLIGVLLVLALWLLAATAAQNGVPLALTGTAAVIGLLVAVVGFTQTSLLPGDGHWIIQVLHAMLGIAAVGVAEAIGGRVRRGRASNSAA